MPTDDSTLRLDSIAKGPSHVATEDLSCQASLPLRDGWKMLFDTPLVLSGLMGRSRAEVSIRLKDFCLWSGRKAQEMYCIVGEGRQYACAVGTQGAGTVLSGRCPLRSCAVRSVHGPVLTLPLLEVIFENSVKVRRRPLNWPSKGDRQDRGASHEIASRGAATPLLESGAPMILGGFPILALVAVASLASGTH